MIMKYFNKLPKLRVAGSTPVSRSEEAFEGPLFFALGAT